MGLFKKKQKEEALDEKVIEQQAELVAKKLKDLKKENTPKRKEPPKPWGKKERYLILFLLLGSVIVSGFLALSSRDFKLPGLPRLKLSGFNLSNLFKGQTIVIEGQDSKVNKINEAKKERITTSFKGMTNSLSGLYAFYLVDSKNSFSFGVNDAEVMQAASLIKLPLMLYSQGKVDDSKLEAMGKRSDNNVFRELVSKFGKETLQTYITNDLRMKNTSIEENTTTPKEMGDLFLGIYSDKEEKLLGFMTDTIFEDYLKKGVPEGIKVSHKYGREVHVINDAGVIYSPNPFVLVIMTQGIVDKEAEEIFPKLTGMIYSEYTKNE